MTGKPWATRDRQNRNGGTPRKEGIVKEATSKRCNLEQQRLAPPERKAIVKEAIGLTDVKTLRARARQGIEDGAMTVGVQGQSGDGDQAAE